MSDARHEPRSVLFLCTGNSARSILAEAILNRIGPQRFRAYSAGSHPKGRVHPETLRLLARLGYETSHLRSKSWQEFSDATTTAIDTIITVCNGAAGEACPVIPNRTDRIHWDIPDPAATSGNSRQIEQAFQCVYDTLRERIAAFLEERRLGGTDNAQV